MIKEPAARICKIGAWTQQPVLILQFLGETTGASSQQCRPGSNNRSQESRANFTTLEQPQEPVARSQDYKYGRNIRSQWIKARSQDYMRGRNYRSQEAEAADECDSMALELITL